MNTPPPPPPPEGAPEGAPHGGAEAVTIAIAVAEPDDPTAQQRAMDLAQRLGLPMWLPPGPDVEAEPGSSYESRPEGRGVLPPSPLPGAGEGAGVRAGSDGPSCISPHPSPLPEGEGGGAPRGCRADAPGGLATEPELLLLVSAERLALTARRGEADTRGGRPVAIDLAGIDTRSAAGASRRQPLYRAVGLHRRAAADTTVADLTAGLGEDAWMLARFGCRVIAFERHPVVAAMLEDALARATPHDARAAARITVQCGDGAAWLAGLQPDAAPDAICLDPMYPEPARRRAAQGKAMKLLRRLVGDDADAPMLLEAALVSPIRRVVVKRPRHAPPLLAVPQPTAIIRGRRVRFDVYIRHEPPGNVDRRPSP